MNRVPSAPRDPRLDELFARYWDGSLTDDGAAELDRRLATDPAAREWFRFLALQAAVVAEGAAVARLRPAASKWGWSRRRVLQLTGAGLAAGAAGLFLGRRPTPEPVAAVPLEEVHGHVQVRDAEGMTLAGARAVPPGGAVTTHGIGSSAVLRYSDGTTVALGGDSALTVAATGRRIDLRRGHATADVRPATGAQSLTLATTVAALTGLGEMVTTLGHALRATEVCVHEGRVAVTDPAGGPLAVVGAGERLSVREGGVRRQPLTAAPDEYALDLTQPLPEAWPVGTRKLLTGGPILVPEPWDDPYYGGTTMYQVRSHQPWAAGLFRCHRDSRVRVRYRAAAPGRGQVCFCVRTPDPRRPDTGMLEYNGGFEATAGQWRWLEIPAAELLTNKHAPGFDAPWVAFLMIVNTFETDLGLRIAELRVTR